MNTPRLVVAGVESGVGKTSLTLGLVAALTRRGLRVQPFKVGPDFLDPTYLRLAAGRDCRNLDTWMCGDDYVRRLFSQVAADADVAVIEGVMGMYDGAWSEHSGGSTAHVAVLLGAPVLLVANAKGAARSFAAMVLGFANFEPQPSVAAVIANRVGSQRHADWLAAALKSHELPPLVGAVPRDALPVLQSRHLGLVSADRENLTRETLERLADAVERHVDLERLLAIADTQTKPLAVAVHLDPMPALPSAGPAVRLGVARDRAFHFYYADNLDMLRRAGAKLIFFSPLDDPGLPPDLGGLYLGGGYPEVYAQALADNTAMREDIRQFAEAGGPVFAECGGLMLLGQRLWNLDNQAFPMCGLFPFETRMLPRLKRLSYTEVAFLHDTPLGPAGTRARGHEFHFSELIADEPVAKQAYSVTRRGAAVETQGFVKKNTLAGYIHLHFASAPAMVPYFIQVCRTYALNGTA